MSGNTERWVDYGFKTVVGILLTIIGGILTFVISQIITLQAANNDQEVRITTLESSSISSKQATDLLLSIQQLTIQQNQIRKELDAFSTQRGEVLEELRELRKDLNTL